VSPVTERPSFNLGECDGGNGTKGTGIATDFGLNSTKFHARVPASAGL
jgi:hypothetical protein